MNRDFDILRDFYKQNRGEIYQHIRNVFEVKHTVKPLNGYMNINKSDLYTFIRHTRQHEMVLRWHSIYKNQRVIDMGAGLGGCYLPLRYCQPSELIAVEPNDDNFDFLVKNVKYDKIIQSRWQEFDYKAKDCVFLKAPWISDWKRLIERLADYSVSNIIIILDFIDDENPKAIYHNKWDRDLTSPHRFTCDEKLEIFYTPSIGFIDDLLEKNGFFIKNKLYASRFQDQKQLIKRYNLHIQKKDIIP